VCVCVWECVCVGGWVVFPTCDRLCLFPPFGNAAECTTTQAVQPCAHAAMRPCSHAPMQPYKPRIHYSCLLSFLPGHEKRKDAKYKDDNRQPATQSATFERLACFRNPIHNLLLLPLQPPTPAHPKPSHHTPFHHGTHHSITPHTIPFHHSYSTYIAFHHSQSHPCYVSTRQLRLYSLTHPLTHCRGPGPCRRVLEEGAGHQALRPQLAETQRAQVDSDAPHVR
jgi:hypothetical protein